MTRSERAPAKINLGLEILGRRPDGYHEIRTVLCTISFADLLTFEEADRDEIIWEMFEFEIPREVDIVLHTLQSMRDAGADIPPQRVTIDKSIPPAAGLGGGSSDAAAAIRAFDGELRAAGIDPTTLAGSLGSDVPFFLNGPAALASGRGEILTPLPSPPEGWVVVALPRLDIPDKTRTMYGAVDSSCWSDGTRVDAIARALPELPTDTPFNVFEQVLLNRFPELVAVRDGMNATGAPFVAVTGAGPAFYTLVDSQETANEISMETASRVGTHGFLTFVAPIGETADD